MSANRIKRAFVCFSELTGSGVRRATMEPGSEEIQKLRRGMRDLAAISALPTVWVKYDEVRVLDSLASALVHMLGLRFVYVFLGGSAGRPDRGVVQTPEGAAPPDRVREVREKLATWLDASSREALPEIEGQGYFELVERVFQTGEPFVGTDMSVILRRKPDGPLERRYVDSFTCRCVTLMGP